MTGGRRRWRGAAWAWGLSVRQGCALQPTRACGLAAGPGDLALRRLEAGGGAGRTTGILIAAPVVADAPADFDGRSDRQVRIVREKVHNACVGATFFGQHLTLFCTVDCLPLLRGLSLRKKCDEPATSLRGLPASASRAPSSCKKVA